MSLADLGRRAVACKHWRWMPGMTVLGAITWRVVERQDLPPYMVCGYDEKSIDDDLPKLDDPATLGCLLHLVREAWPEEWHKFMAPIFDGMSHWYMGCMRMGTPRIIIPTRLMQDGLPDVLPPKSSEAEALVRALEAAP